MLKQKIENILIKSVGEPPTQNNLARWQSQLDSLFEKEALDIKFELVFNEIARSLTLNSLNEASEQMIREILNER